MEGTPMTSRRVRIHKITWNGNDGEEWYSDAGGAADHLRALLGRFGFRCGTPVARPGGDGTLHALPVVKRGCSLTELPDVCRNDPGLEIRTRLPALGRYYCLQPRPLYGTLEKASRIP